MRNVTVQVAVVPDGMRKKGTEEKGKHHVGGLSDVSVEAIHSLRCDRLDFDRNPTDGKCRSEFPARVDEGITALIERARVAGWRREGREPWVQDVCPMHAAADDATQTMRAFPHLRTPLPCPREVVDASA